MDGWVKSIVRSFLDARRFLLDAINLRAEGFAEEFGDDDDIKYIDCIIAVHIIAFISLPVGHC